MGSGVLGRGDGGLLVGGGVDGLATGAVVTGAVVTGGAVVGVASGVTVGSPQGHSKVTLNDERPFGP